MRSFRVRKNVEECVVVCPGVCKERSCESHLPASVLLVGTVVA